MYRINVTMHNHVYYLHTLNNSLGALTILLAFHTLSGQKLHTPQTNKVCLDLTLSRM